MPKFILIITHKLLIVTRGHIETILSQLRKLREHPKFAVCHAIKTPAIFTSSAAQTMDVIFRGDNLRHNIDLVNT